VSGSTGTLWRQFNEGEPLCLVLYSSLGALEDTIETVQLVAPSSWTPMRTTDIEDAFRKLDEPLLLTPRDEVAAILTLDGRREALLGRTAPAFMFILKGGGAEKALRTAPGLASWLGGHVFDPEPAEIDVEHEQHRFETETGQSSQQWLAAWQHGEIPDTLDNNLLYQRALLLGET
jgi:hypothetical protein